MKRFTAILLSCLMIIGCTVFAATSVSAAGEKPFKLTVTSNLFPTTVSEYASFETNDAGEEFVTVECKLCTPSMYIINFDINEINWDPNVLTFRTSDNIMGSGRKAAVCLTPFTYEQQRGTGTFNFEKNKIDNGILLGNFSYVGSVQTPATYGYNEDGSAITFLKIKFLVKDKSAGETTVNVNVLDLNLDDITDTQPRSKYTLVKQGEVSAQSVDSYVTETAVETDGEEKALAYKLSGEVVCGANSEANVNENVTLALTKKGETEAKYTTSVSAGTKSSNVYKGAYEFAGVEAGEYTLTVSKKNNVTRDYAVEVTADTVQDVKIHLKGDVSGDGRYRGNDAAMAFKASTKEDEDVLDAYQKLVADVSGDGRIRGNDCAKIFTQSTGKQVIFTD